MRVYANARCRWKWKESDNAQFSNVSILDRLERELPPLRMRIRDIEHVERFESDPGCTL